MQSRVLILPGFGGSGPDHWQSRWEAIHPSFRRVQQSDWNRPDLDDWLFSLDAAFASSAPDVVLVAHSLGCLLAVHWASEEMKLRSLARSRGDIVTTIGGALLVAPPDPATLEFPRVASSFVPVPMITLPFPSIVVASSNDTYASIEYGQRCAQAWGSRFVDIGEAGHINADSGLGIWPLGLDLLAELVPDLPVSGGGGDSN